MDKNTGRIAVYKVKENANDQYLFCLQLRARCNPELTYFAMTTVRANDEGVMDMVTSVLKKRTLSQSAIDRIGGVIRL